ncbi:hypothetical protein L3Q82_007110 [Scortum barcoo]|uniref:Uncharacterized protein n=1 Tax=Scortum barcoo TaxID=214431 RepID=A0ACB8WVQ5_9TELE|nr:hypothetical protein L3Q82_007110 [Scortum barcoo]
MQSLISRLEGFTAASPSPPAAPAPPASPATTAAAPPQPPPAPSSVPVSSAPVRLASPPKFSGECRPFLIQCDLHFFHGPKRLRFGASSSYSVYGFSHDREGGCLGYGRLVSGAQVCQTAKDFSQALLRVFDQTSPAREVSSLLCSRSSRDAGGWWIMPLNSARWRRTADGTRLPSSAHSLTASHGGSKRLSGSVGHPKGLRKPSRNSLSSIDNRLRERERERDVGRVASLRGSRGHRTPSVSFADRATCLPQYQSLPRPLLGAEEPMQLGRTKLAPEERQRRLKEGVCFYCGKSGHQVNRCPAKEEAHQG